MLLPDGRLLDGNDQTVVTVLLPTAKPATGLNVEVSDEQRNHAARDTDKKGQITVPDASGSAGEIIGTSVVAFDYSKKMIELAKRRQSQYAKQIEFCVADATDRKSILELKRNRAFTKAVSNMAIMDITDIEPLLMAVYELLQESGIFVFATQHPCFVTLTEKYMTPHSYYDIAIEGQPKEQIYYHRSIQDIFNLCFRAGFVIDGFYEECFKTNKEIPMVMIVRLKKVKRDSLK